MTFQDHPYQPAFLDTWTLMSYVAASTERIKISGNVIIDQAAAAAARDPREIRRLLNITPDKATVDDLLPFAVRDGVSAFILASDDPRAIQAWGEEVAPALREAVARERQAAGTPSGQVVRSPKALALRRDGIGYDAVPPALKATAVEPGDKAYPKVRSTYLRSGAPGLVLRPAHLRAPIYLHPRAPLPVVNQAYYRGFGEPLDSLLATGACGPGTGAATAFKPASPGASCQGAQPDG